MGMLPGIGKMKEQLANAGIDDKMLKRQEAIISSMTKEERRNPELLNGSRKRRIAPGSGTSVAGGQPPREAVLEMQRMMKQV